MKTEPFCLTCSNPNLTEGNKIVQENHGLSELFRCEYCGDQFGFPVADAKLFNVFPYVHLNLV